MDEFLRYRQIKAIVPGIWPAPQRTCLRNSVVLSHGGGTFTHAIPPAFAACIPISVSSNTRQAFGSTPRFAAARRNASGSGLLFVYSPAQTSVSNRSRSFSTLNDAVTESLLL